MFFNDISIQKNTIFMELKQNIILVAIYVAIHNHFIK